MFWSMNKRQSELGFLIENMDALFPDSRRMRMRHAQRRDEILKRCGVQVFRNLEKEAAHFHNEYGDFEPDQLEAVVHREMKKKSLSWLIGLPKERHWLPY